MAPGPVSYPTEPLPTGIANGKCGGNSTRSETPRAMAQ